MRALLSALAAAVLLVGIASPASAGAGHRPGSIRLSAATVSEDAAPGTDVGMLAARDRDRRDKHTFALVPGSGDRSNGLFAISGNQLQVAGALDHETAPVLSVRVRVTDRSGLSRERSFHIAVADVNEAPTRITLTPDSIAEGYWGGVVGALSAVDPDTDDRHAFALVPGAGDSDNGLFAISRTQLRSMTIFDFEERSTYEVRVRVTDAAGATYEQPLTVHVTDGPEIVLNHAPTDITIDRDRTSLVDGLIGTLTAVDPDPGDTHTFRLVGVPHGHSDMRFFFPIIGNGLYLQTSCGVSFETYTVVIEATDSTGLSVQVTIPITVGPAPPRSLAARRC
jgi:hypothetical protein